ncbi:hypothetical protein ZIOFF_015683 [Zingiber officinale]|uniref:Uncharacterized protein n=1 Tax=Zingiber officinale TaxID=94328 RepID=A0A8J5HJ61_ZINOF|nr:hypothetical protein ZIOFF_015683 [Zingiber officinale]
MPELPSNPTSVANFDETEADGDNGDVASSRRMAEATRAKSRRGSEYQMGGFVKEFRWEQKDLELVLEKEKALGDYLFCVIDVESRDSRASGGSIVSPPHLLEDQAQLLLLSLLVPTASSALPASRAPGGSAASPSVGRSNIADSAPAANSAIQASLESNEISKQIIDKGDSVTKNLIEDGNLLHKSKKQKRSLIWSDMIEVEDPKGDKYKCKH